MSDCTICGKQKPGFYLHNKSVCMRCDELTFDLEIELDEVVTKPQPKKDPTAKPTIRTISAKK